MLATFFSYILFTLKTLPYKDIVEVLFFSTICYYILLWLKKDTERNLIFYFYAYTGIFLTAHYADLPVIRFVLLLSAPVIALLFIIIHQETLQKNFIKLSKAPLSTYETSHWVDELLKCCLMALNRHKEIVLVIERNDSLKSLIQAPYYIYAELKKDVFDILLDKHITGTEYMIWINQQGKLVAINASWRSQLDDTWISKEAEHMHTWKQHGLFITDKTDALMFKVNPLTRSFDLATQGRIIETMNAEQASAFMKKNLVAKTPPKAQKTEKQIERGA
jgi:hypothetical protein